MDFIEILATIFANIMMSVALFSVNSWITLIFIIALYLAIYALFFNSMYKFYKEDQNKVINILKGIK